MLCPMAASPRAREVIVALDDPSELFEAQPADVLAGLPPRPAGIDQIRDQLSAQRLPAQVVVSIRLPAGKMTPLIEQGIVQSISRYCDSRIAKTDAELSAVRRDGAQTLVFGLVILAVFLLLSEATLHSTFPKDLRDFLGNGLFLVAAWVGLWYPLDTLIYSGRPHRYERKLLRKLRTAQIHVRVASH